MIAVVAFSTLLPIKFILALSVLSVLSAIKANNFSPEFLGGLEPIGQRITSRITTQSADNLPRK